jgi:two-component system, chemotaxis family, chemotaxis protein CheY
MSTSTPTALVVDDSRAMRSLLKRMLGELGYATIEAADGQQALEVLEANGPCELGLVDWNMPVMNGLELVRALRSERRYDKLRLVMVTSEASPRNVYEAMKAGADEYALKPVDVDALNDKLHLMGVTAPRDLLTAP